MLLRALGLLAAAGASAPPSIYWVSKPVLTNETVLVAGAGLGSSAISFCHDAACAQARRLPPAGGERALAWESSVQAVLPAGCRPCWLAIGSKPMTAVQVNAPEVAWIPAGAEPGGILRVFGRALAWRDERCAEAASSPGPVATTTLRISGHSLTAVRANCFEAAFELPESIAAGAHNLTVSTPWGESLPLLATVTLPSRGTVTVIDVEKDQ